MEDRKITKNRIRHPTILVWLLSVSTAFHSLTVLHYLTLWTWVQAYNQRHFCLKRLKALVWKTWQCYFRSVHTTLNTELSSRKNAGKVFLFPLDPYKVSISSLVPTLWPQGPWRGLENPDYLGESRSCLPKWVHLQASCQPV